MTLSTDAVSLPLRSLILASTSVYRRELLHRLQLPFEVQSPGVDESPRPAETPRATALRLSEDKARAVAARFTKAVVIGSDQVAELDGEPLGKPGDHAMAVRQLRGMQGRSITFHTALTVCCIDSGFQQSDVATVLVRMRPLDAAAIERYLLAEQPYDCAGSAKSEGLGIALLESIYSDDPTALIGLPLIRCCRMLRAAGIELP